MPSVFRRIPPLYLLIVFEAGARHVSFTCVTEELSVTSSAVSYRIKSLRELWGEDLFVHTGTALWLAATGTHYLCSM